MMPLSFSLSGRTALVTGGASGIGTAIAIGIAESGAAIGLIDRPGADFAAAIAAVEGAGGRVLAVEADVTEDGAMRKAVEAIERELGPLSAAVNAAGIANAAPAESMPRDQWQRVLDVDLTGVFLSCQAEGTAMIANGGGSIVNIASMSGRIANRGLDQVHYNSAKAAVIHLSASLATEWAEHGVRVNSISPGYTATPMNTRPEMVDRMRMFADSVPMRRVAEPAEMAGPAVFLLSEAASYVTGTDLLVDGGHCAW
jgi:NAD(P)-dependent dehydrogenase (short-subunit alcohol dehydrogenase family)